MPCKPMKPCTSPMCAELTRDKYCSKHQDKVQENTRHYDKYIRNKSSRSFYNSRVWKDMRELMYRRDHGLCVKCRSNDIMKRGDVVDHIVPLLVDWTKRLDPSNL
ncbi:HNH endonuclease, partial [Bacillus thuringiensis]